MKKLQTLKSFQNETIENSKELKTILGGGKWETKFTVPEGDVLDHECPNGNTVFKYLF